MKPIQTLVRYKAWADDVFLSVVATLPEPELAAPRPIYFGSIIRTLNHSYAMDFVWQSHLLGRPHGLATRNPADHPPIQELISAQRRMDAWYVDYAEALSNDELDEVVEFEFIGEAPNHVAWRHTLPWSITRLIRGHVADMLYTSVSSPTTDYPFFFGRALRLTFSSPTRSRVAGSAVKRR